MQFSFHILFLTLLLSASTPSQQLPHGTFIFDTGYTYTEFTFKGKSRFEYKYRSCTGGQEGKGTYLFSNNELELAFDNPGPKRMPPMPLLVRKEIQADTSSISFSFFEPRDNSPVTGVTMRYQSKSDSITYGTISNESGQANLWFANNEFPLTIEISFILMQPKTIRLDSFGQYSLAFPMNFEFMQPLVKGDTLRFVIDSYNYEELSLKPVGDEEFRTFQRKAL